MSPEAEGSAWDSADIQVNSVICPETGGNQ